MQLARGGVRAVVALRVAMMLWSIIMISPALSPCPDTSPMPTQAPPSTGSTS